MPSLLLENLKPKNRSKNLASRITLEFNARFILKGFFAVIEINNRFRFEFLIFGFWRRIIVTEDAFAVM